MDELFESTVKNNIDKFRLGHFYLGKKTYEAIIALPPDDKIYKFIYDERGDQKFHKQEEELTPFDVVCTPTNLSKETSERLRRWYELGNHD